ncbi:uncharacterized protein LOC134539428 [Bacillus rossius redtenbacheri]|uniref:uncharacterized protein LOC134539428 n=1 Tax=Bacillus rossius redtenbacheri TaxID=93214 RepID=UPI002FDE7192
MSAPYLWPYKCAASGCKSRGKKNRLFRFPQGNGPAGKARVQKWLDCAQNPKVNTTHAYMCELHFNERQFRDNDRTMLIYRAVPTIRLENGVYVDTEPPVNYCLQLPEDASVQHSKDTSVEHPEDSPTQCPEDSFVNYSENGSLVYLEHTSSQHPGDDCVEYTEDDYLQYSEDPEDNSDQVPIVTSVYRTEDASAEETSPGADGFDHIYAKHSELPESQLFYAQDMAQTGNKQYNSSKKIKKASFTVYVITPKSEGSPEVISIPRKEKRKSSDRSTNWDKVQASELGFEEAFVTDVDQETSSMVLHSSASCRQVTAREKKLIMLVSHRVRSLKQVRRKYEGQSPPLRSVCSVDSQPVRELDELSQSMSLAATNFLASRVFGRRRQRKGRKWSLEDKVHALALYKRLPKCYTLLSTVFELPSKKSLSNTLARISWRPGYNKNIFESLVKTVSGMDAIDRTCLLLFDEMPLKERLQYDSRTDSIVGFEDWGHLGKRDKFGSHALVFLLKGLRRKWVQPVAFYVTAGSLSVELLRSVLQSCWRAGLNVVATVCNMKASNSRMLRRLGATEDNPSLHIGCNSVVTLYNPPQLLKATRNMLFKHNVLVKHNVAGRTKESTASWSVFGKARDIDRRREPFRILSKLTDDHLEPRGEAVENVAMAAQVLSSTVATTIRRFVSAGLLEPSALATAHFAGLCDALLDSLNGTAARPQGAGGRRCQLRAEREALHLSFWEQCEGELRQWRAGSFRPECLSGWVSTLRGMALLWARLKQLGFTRVQPRALNLDLLHHLFASVRASSGRTADPTAAQFASALKTLVLSGLPCVQESDCEEGCDAFQLLSDPCEWVARSPRKMCAHGTFGCPNDEFSLAYVVDGIVKELDGSCECDDCRGALFAATLEEHARCAAMFWATSDRRPSRSLLRCVARASCLLERVLPNVAHADAVLSRLVTAMKERVSFAWLSEACSLHAEHVRNLILVTLCRALIPRWCRNRCHRLSDCTEIQLQVSRAALPEQR